MLHFICPYDRDETSLPSVILFDCVDNRLISFGYNASWLKNYYETDDNLNLSVKFLKNNFKEENLKEIFVDYNDEIISKYKKGINFSTLGKGNNKIEVLKSFNKDFYYNNAKFVNKIRNYLNKLIRKEKIENLLR